jgi:hypothetical protein
MGNIGPAGANGVNGTIAVVANTSPLPGTTGQLWYDVEDATVSVYNGSNWIVTSGPAGPIGPAGPTGAQGPTGKVIDSVLSETVSRTLTLADSSDMLFVNTSSNTIFTIPDDGTTNFPVPSTVHFARNGTGTVTVAGAAGVTVRIRNGFTNTLAVQYSIASVTKVSANTWYLYGDLT